MRSQAHVCRSIDSTGGNNREMKKALRETQTLRAAYAGGVHPQSLYHIWSRLLNSFKSN